MLLYKYNTKNTHLYHLQPSTILYLTTETAITLLCYGESAYVD